MMILGFAGIGFMAYRRRGQPGFRFTPTLAGVPAPPSTFVTRVFKSRHASPNNSQSPPQAIVISQSFLMVLAPAPIVNRHLTLIDPSFFLT
jgi:hypothetical protein